jgi:hypothetical protein
MKMDLVLHADEHERYAQTAFDSQIGKEVPGDRGRHPPYRRRTSSQGRR